MSKKANTNKSFVATGASESFQGGAGFDVVSYEKSTGVINAFLETGVGSGGFAQGDQFVSIEGLAGSNFGDTLWGDDRGNSLDGRGGDDALMGFGGNDLLVGGAGKDRLDGGAGTDSVNGGLGSDVLGFDFSSWQAGDRDIYNGGTGGASATDLVDTLELRFASEEQWATYEASVSAFEIFLDQNRTATGEANTAIYDFGFGLSVTQVEQIKVYVGDALILA